MTSLSRPFNHLRTRWPFLNQLDTGLIVGILVTILCVGIFVSTAEDVRENDPLVQIDQAIANHLHQEGLESPQAIIVYKAISNIGLPGVWVMGFAVGLIFAFRRQRLHLLVWIVTLVGGILLNNAIKVTFARARPVFVDPFVIEQNFSFPSGHSMIAVVGFGLLAYFLCRGTSSLIARIVIVFATVLLIVLIGFSRLALGVHFFSDVVGGFAAGGAWLALCITLLDQLSRRQLQTEAPPQSRSPL